jgi:hypothetical protein
VTLSGEAVTDEVLLNIARTNGANLVSVKLLGTGAVTDAGITALVCSAPQLKVFMLEDAGRGVVGTFVPVILQSCKQLETLHIEGAEGVSWQQLQQTGAWWRALPPTAATDSHAVAAAAGSNSGAAVGSSRQAALLQQQQQLAPAGSGPSSSADGGNVQQHALRQRHHHRVSSDASDCLSDEDTEGCFSDDGSLGAASDSTSISVPAAATAALAEQLQHSHLQDEAASNRQAALLLQQAPHPHPPQQQQQAPDEQQQVEQQPLQQQQGRSMLCHTALRRLRIRFAAVDSLTPLLELCPGLTDLQLDGPALNIQAAAAACPNIKRLAFLVDSPHELDAALFYLNGMGSLRGLELEVKGMMLSTEQLRVSFGSYAARQQVQRVALALVDHGLSSNSCVDARSCREVHASVCAFRLSQVAYCWCLGCSSTDLRRFV